ncbi:hypothetical protein MesoLjLc_06590 [Mesorhizobium sp. L-8-10]|uniref:hypothetical protein n=1 Tax=unclassified Mesorhizobium TaxID=325217 RepID=UPI001925A278|nr:MULTISPECIES: hypothetical protein [unclassified Mesorhizobium]BCH20903.1 hypothetical protein MesoLjLb_06880 [Mesorhizobium sp. L-8-3]BCH28729.1 hypothetical protein MesoLjLc_06590 [Mesorhizobium sp. L-8-10]
MKSVAATVVASVGSVLFAGNVLAADMVSPVAPAAEQITTESGWTFAVAPYFWAAGLSGDVASFGLPPVHVDADFAEIFDHLKFGAMAIGEARYGPYSIFGDVMYTKLSGSKGTPLGILATSAEVTSETFAGLVGAGYSIVDNASARLDIIGGVRIWSASTEISLSGGILDGVSRSDSATWADAVAGLRGNYSITSNVYLTGWGYVGAGGADVDWDVAGAIGYRFNDRISAVAGYRALGVDYSSDDFVFDVVQQGPILGMVFRF